ARIAPEPPRARHALHPDGGVRQGDRRPRALPEPRPRLRRPAAGARADPAHPQASLPSQLIEAPAMQIDPAALSSRDAYRLMISCIIPRPIAFVTTLSREGVTNLAP